MYKIKHNLSPNVFKNKFYKIDHKYPTRHSMHSFYHPKTISKTTSFSILNRGPYLWNRILNNDEKSVATFSSFKKVIKHKLLYSEKETTNF